MRFLSGFSILALLIAAVIVLTGNQQQANTFFGPSTTSSPSPVGKANTIAAAQEFSALYTDAQLELTSNPQDTVRELTAALAKDEPEYNVGQPIKSGGIAVGLFHLKQGTVIRLCSFTSLESTYQCSANKAVGATSGLGVSASAKTLHQAEEPLLSELFHGKTSQSSSSVVQQAQQAAKAGG